MNRVSKNTSKSIRKKISRNCALVAILLVAGSAGTGYAADNAAIGANILFWTPQQQVLGYRAIDQLFSTREIRGSKTPYPLLPDPMDLSAFRYRHDGRRLTVDDYIREMRVAGLIVVKDDRVLLERYALGNDRSSRWISFSVAKSVVSMLIGAAIRDGYFQGVDDKVVDYLPQLRGGGYDETTIRDILQMASGVRWNEDYSDPESDVARSPGGTLALFRYMQKLPREADPGEKFNYNTGETNIAGALLRAAIGNNLSVYLQHRIWQPFGMEADASWLLEAPGGVELGGCCINATLRDYARIGLFALRDGVLPGGERVLPEGWMQESTTPSKGYDGYGYYWWLEEDGVYAARGVFGQLIRIDPARNLVIAMHEAWPNAGDPDLWAHQSAFLEALSTALD